MQQRTFDDLGTPLSDVTFVVLDLETTGGSPDACAITEIGALKFKGGECLGTFQTLVNPGMTIPPEIVYLTGITQAMVTPAPRIESVLPAFLEFLGDAVIVGHNVRFDVGFLQANLARQGYSRLRHKIVDTCALARRLVRDEVRDCRLATLARHFRTAADPCHRALDDARATAEVLHCLLERAGTLGVFFLDDLLALPTTAAHPQVNKLRWVANLPRSPGVYVFRDRAGRPLYVGKAVDLRRRVRSYFAGDERRKIGPLLREAHSLDHVVCAHELHASVLEVRMIQQLRPRYNRRDKNADKSVYVKLTANEPFPRLSIARTRSPRDKGTFLGPLPSTAVAKLVIEAIETAVPLRRCTSRVTAAFREGPCAPAQLGVSTCPCAGAIGADDYAAIAAQAAAAMTTDPALVLEPLAARMRVLATTSRFEEAASVRDRANAFARAIERQRRLDGFTAAGRLVLDIDGGGAVIDAGRLVASWRPGERAYQGELDLWADANDGGLLSKEAAAEVLCVAGWLEKTRADVRLVSCDGELAWPVAAVPRFEPRRTTRSGRAAA